MFSDVLLQTLDFPDLKLLWRLIDHISDEIEELDDEWMFHPIRQVLVECEDVKRLLHTVFLRYFAPGVVDVRKRDDLVASTFSVCVTSREEVTEAVIPFHQLPSDRAGLLCVLHRDSGVVDGDVFAFAPTTSKARGDAKGDARSDEPLHLSTDPYSCILVPPGWSFGMTPFRALYETTEPQYVQLLLLEIPVHVNELLRFMVNTFELNALQYVLLRLEELDAGQFQSGFVHKLRELKLMISTFGEEEDTEEEQSIESNDEDLNVTYLTDQTDEDAEGLAEVEELDEVLDEVEKLNEMLSIMQEELDAFRGYEEEPQRDVWYDRLTSVA